MASRHMPEEILFLYDGAQHHRPLQHIHRVPTRLNNDVDPPCWSVSQHPGKRTRVFHPFLSSGFGFILLRFLFIVEEGHRRPKHMGQHRRPREMRARNQAVARAGRALPPRRPPRMPPRATRRPPCSRPRAGGGRAGRMRPTPLRSRPSHGLLLARAPTGIPIPEF